MTEDAFVDAVVRQASSLGYRIENSRNGRQIDFGHKKLHEDHLRALFPSILTDAANVAGLIEAVAPGRPCTHEPMREIVSRIRNGSTGG